MANEAEEFIPTRRTLLSRLRDWRDQTSWQQFFDTYWKLIYGVALKSGLTEAEAQDAVQETVIAVAKKMPGFQYDPDLGSFKSWLLQITRRRIADQFRKRSPQMVSQQEKGSGHSRTSTVERIPDPASLLGDSLWEEEWQKSLADAAMEKVKRRVDPAEYQMFDLVVFKQWPVRRVASKFRVTAAHVYYARYKVSGLIKKEAKRLETKLF